MRIRCPSCAATYKVPDALLLPPRMVRCARCAHDWMAEEIDEAPPPSDVAEVVEEPVPAEVEPPTAIEPSVEEPAPPPYEPMPDLVPGDTPLSAIERLAIPSDLSTVIRRRDRLLTAAWAASFAILAALGVAGYTERGALMRQWPASKRVYAKLGLAPDAASDGAGAKSADTTPPARDAAATPSR